MSERRSFCRICTAQCPIRVEIDDDGRPVGVRPDVSDPLYEGFFCVKGRDYAYAHTHPDRLLRSQRREADGRFSAIASEQAMDEIAERVAGILERHGPRSVAMYSGTIFYQNAATAAVATAWMDAIRSPMRFSSGTIDQPGKQVASALHGQWRAGAHAFDECDTWMLVGANPLVSISGGIPHANPGRRLKRARARGLQLLVIDPRRTETARMAAVHLQPAPGHDAVILAGMLRVILAEGRHDAAFVDTFASGLDALRAAVEPFTPERVSERADVAADDVVRAARIFADAQRGSVSVGTGPNMSGHGNLVEYLALVLNTVCGRWRRAGERVSNPGVLTTERPFYEGVFPPFPAAGLGERLRVRGFSLAACGLPTSALADEILLEGEGQVKALFTVGGNPMMAWPDQRKTFDALNALELHVALDPKLTPTSRLADYVIAPKLPFEHPGTTLPTENLNAIAVSFGYGEPYAHYAPAITEPPPGADVVEDWRFFYGLAQRMGLPLRVTAGVFAYPGVRAPRIDLDMASAPSPDELTALLSTGSRVPLDAVRAATGGALFPGEPVHVGARPADDAARFELAAPGMLDELAELARAPWVPRSAAPSLPFRLISRRMANAFNSVGTDHPALRDRYGCNPAFMHPDDLAEAGIAKGDLVRLASAHGEVRGVAWPDPSLRRGLVSMMHAWGENPDVDADPRAVGANTGRLMSVEVDYDAISGIPLMSALPVRVDRLEGATAE